MAHEWAEHLTEDHARIERVLDAVGRALEKPEGGGAAVVRLAVVFLRDFADGCHNKKEEEHLFPLLEQRGVPRHGGPLAVMLGEHAESQRILADLLPLMADVAKGDAALLDRCRQLFGAYAQLMKGHYWKENDILYPMGKRVLSPEDGEAVMRGIVSLEARLGPDTRVRFRDLGMQIESLGGVGNLAAGLSGEVMGAVLDTLPVELSFVDETDTVRYFSHEHHPKIFARTRGVIGNKVQNCHPQKSVHVVNQILEDFKAGKREVAEFWIDFSGKKVHIRYVPVRDRAGRYLGCLETVQDVTAIQALTGQKRLLDG
jgi:hypothetical protein